jgi:hypothetical protein
MKNKTLKIFLGPVDIGFRLAAYKDFLQKHGSDIAKITTAVIFKLPESHFRTRYDFADDYFKGPGLFRYLKIIRDFPRFLFSHNLFFFLSGETLTTRSLRKFEFWLMRMLGKKIIMSFVGSDIRNEDWLAEKEKVLAGEIKTIKAPRSCPHQVKLLSESEKFAEKLLVSTPDLLEIVPDAEYFPALINPDEFLANYREATKNSLREKGSSSSITVYHLPSNPITKGSRWIKNQITDLPEPGSGKVEVFIPDLSRQRTPGLKYPLTRYEVLEHLSRADIVIDQVLTGWYGLQAVEAALAGCCVVVGIDPALKKYLDPNCPFFISSAENLRQDLIRLLQDFNPGQREERARKARLWVERVHTLEGRKEKFLSFFNFSSHGRT